MNARIAAATAALILGTALSTTAMAQTAPAYRYSGPHAGGPADALIPSGTPQAVVHTSRPAAYRYSGPHAGGPANALIRTGTPRAVVHAPKPAAYRYSGPHAGGPANDLPRY